MRYSLFGLLVTSLLLSCDVTQGKDHGEPHPRDVPGAKNFRNSDRLEGSQQIEVI